MRIRLAIAGAGVLLVGGAVAFAVRAEPIAEVRAPAPVVFVCRNGVAMSVWSAAYFNRLAVARNPFHLGAVEGLVEAYERLGNREEVERYRRRADKLRQAETGPQTSSFFAASV